MRFSLLSLSLAALILGGCAHEGVIVQKQSRPHPFYESLGVDGMYAFMLRDSSGAVHRQLVREDVFDRYAEGDYFNDLKPGPSYDGKSDGKTMVRMSARSSRMASDLARRTASSKARRLALKPSTKRKNEVTLLANTDLTVATTAIIKTKSASVSSTKSKTVSAHVRKKPTKAATKTATPAKTTTTVVKSESSATPVLPTTGAGTPEDPRIVYVPPRVR